MKKWIIILVGALVALLVLVTCNQKKEQTAPASNNSKASLTSSASSKKSERGTNSSELDGKADIRKLLIQALSSIRKLKLKSLPRKLAKERKRLQQLLVWI